MAAKSNPKTRPVYSNDQIVSAAAGTQWGEAAEAVKPAIPYVIKLPDSDEEIVVPVLTRRRRKKLKASQATYLMMGAQLGELVKDPDPDKTVLNRIQALIDESEQAYDEALFGDAYEQVVDFFEELPEEWWDAMYADVHEKLVNRVEVPEDTCPRCGQHIGDDDEEGGEGKGPSSSTSSSSTGRKLKAISDTTSA